MLTVLVVTYSNVDVTRVFLPERRGTDVLVGYGGDRTSTSRSLLTPLDTGDRLVSW